MSNSFIQIMRDESGRSKGFGFVQYDSFEAADLSIASMNGQWLMNKQITVQYALKKDSKSERHGSLAERILAANNPASRRGPPGAQMPPFMSAPPMSQPGYPPGAPQMMGSLNFLLGTESLLVFFFDTISP
jgi:splicing factor 3B subunit 4